MTCKEKVPEDPGAWGRLHFISMIELDASIKQQGYSPITWQRGRMREEKATLWKSLVRVTNAILTRADPSWFNYTLKTTL